MKRRRIKKVYGESQIKRCHFCGRQATQQNDQGVVVCYQHRQQKVEQRRCVCGEPLEVRSGKFGQYFHCYKCGNINWDKAMSASTTMETPKPVPEKKSYRQTQKETTITTDDAWYFS